MSRFALLMLALAVPLATGCVAHVDSGGDAPGALGDASSGQCASVVSDCQDCYEHCSVLADQYATECWAMCDGEICTAASCTASCPASSTCVAPAGNQVYGSCNNDNQHMTSCNPSNATMDCDYASRFLDPSVAAVLECDAQSRCSGPVDCPSLPADSFGDALCARCSSGGLCRGDGAVFLDALHAMLAPQFQKALDRCMSNQPCDNTWSCVSHIAGELYPALANY